MSPERARWPFKEHWIDIAWAAFAASNLVGMVTFPSWETVPFHFIWVSLTVLYGFRVWRVKPTVWTLVAVMVSTGGLIAVDVSRGTQPIDEITEVPLMAAMFVAMVWHARRRLAAMQEIEQMSDANVRLLERERRFVQDASHELRTPITVALGQVELIERTATDAGIRRDAAVAADELLRLRRLADRLLLLASAEHPSFLRRTPTDVDGIVLDALRRWAPTPRTWVHGALGGALVDVDHERIDMALDSLIENAVNHTSPGATIELSAHRNGSAVSIAVADSGEGIEAEQLERIFDRFGRADSGRSRQAGGVGLGLSIVKAIAEAHGGSVRVRSRTGEGSVFEMELPLFQQLPDGQPVPEPEQLMPMGGRRASPR
jgi:signal transduction histidine kinase